MKSTSCASRAIILSSAQMSIWYCLRGSQYLVKTVVDASKSIICICVYYTQIMTDKTLRWKLQSLGAFHCEHLFKKIHILIFETLNQIKISTVHFQVLLDFYIFTTENRKKNWICANLHKYDVFCFSRKIFFNIQNAGLEIQ